MDEIYEYDLDSTAEELDEYCKKADFVFNLAGVNRPEDLEILNMDSLKRLERNCFLTMQKRQGQRWLFIVSQT